MNRFCRAAILIAAATAVSGCRGAAGEPERIVSMKVMTFNVLDESAGGWTDSRGTGRGEKAVATIKSLAPDIIGLQEDTKTQDATIAAGLGGEYEAFGVGGMDGAEQGRFNSVFYRGGRFERLDGGTIWLSDQPDKPGSSPQKDGYPRTATWLILRDRGSGLKFFFLNAHWDNGYRSNRLLSAALLRERIARLAAGLPVIVTGDLNCTEDSQELQNFLGAADPDGRKLIDAFRKLNPEKKPDDEGTCENNPHAPRIDFILHTDDIEPQAIAICRDKFLGGWASDHFPVTATLAIHPADR